MVAPDELAGRTVAVVPAYREADFIADVVCGVLEVLGECVVVDDGSDDGTGGRAGGAGARVLPHERNRGKGAAIKTGLQWFLDREQYDYVVLLDGDGQHRPEEIGRFLERAASRDARLVVGNRMSDTRDMPWVRRMVNGYMSWRISRVCGQRIPDSQCGFRMLHREVAPHILGSTNAFDFETEMLFIASLRGIRVDAVPVSTVYGEETSKIHPVRDTLRFFQLLARYRRRMRGMDRKSP